MSSTQTKGNQTEQNPLGYQPIGKLLITFSVPAIIACLINSVYNIVDQIFIGQGVGYLGNAATTVAFPIMTILMAFGTLVGSGAGAYASIRLGEKNHEQAEKTLNNAFWVSIIIGAILMVIGLAFLEPILVIFGATKTVLPYAIDYTSIILLGTPFSMVAISLSSLARTDGHPRLSMYGMLIGAVLNTILDPIYIFVFQWGVKGAAIATVTSQIISAVILGLYFLKDNGKQQHMRLRKKYILLDFSLIRKFVVLGISSGITQGVACLMQVVMNKSLVYYGAQSPIGGDAALSAMGIVMKIAMIMAAFGIGIGIGAQPILGYNQGAGHYHRIRKTYLLSIAFATGLISACWLICQIMPEQIIALFGKENQEFTDFAVKCLRIYLFGIFCAGFQIVSTTYFQATGQPLKASVLSMLRQLLLLIPLILILPLFWGLEGILYSAPVADIVSAIVVGIMILPEMKKLQNNIRKEDLQTV